MKVALCLSLIAVANVVHGQVSRIDPLVLTEQGLVRGLHADDGTYSLFLGIPYATVDSTNPFGPAQKHPGFGDEVYDAIDDSIICVQSSSSALPLRAGSDVTQAVDCLRLNVFVPNNATSKKPLSVLVYIHGGGFTRGSSHKVGTPHLVQHDVIVVVMNYRVGPYGFFCLDTPLASGNQGLKDQYEALRWVRNNIAAFGGDPNNVTLGGFSVGGASVIYHLYGDKEKLYNQIIVESGVPQCDGLFVEGDLDAAIKMADYLGFQTNDTEEALVYLGNASHNLVIEAFVETGVRLMPCIEKSFRGVDIFVESDPLSISNQQKVRSTPVMIGFTENEIFGPIEDIYNGEYFDDPFYYRVQRNFNLNDKQMKKATNLVRNFYIKDGPVTPEVYKSIELYDADFVFNHPIHRTIDSLLHENAGPIYQYLFKYNGTFGFYHAVDKFYLFNMNLDFPTDMNKEDKLISERWTLLWANFIKYGNPTPEVSDLVPVLWKPITEETRPYLVIDNEMILDNRVYNERMAFWDLFYLNYRNFHKHIRTHGL